jgi:SAM-dependent methyltransferase
MLDATQRTAEKLGIHNIELVEMDAENLRFPRSSFDAVTCCCGLPFCQDPIQALREMRRVMVPGGRIALSVWDAPEKNPFFTTIGDVIATLVEPSARPEQRRAWPFSHADELSRAFRAAGFAEFDVESRALTFEVDSVDDYWRLFVDFAAGVASKLAAVPAARVESARNELGAAAETFRDGSRLRFPASALCVSGAR